MDAYIFREPDLKYRVISISIVIILCLMIILGSFFIAPDIGYIPFFVICFGVLTLIIYFHSIIAGYKCKNCEHEFQISFWRDLASAHSSSKKYLECPKCRYKDYATELVRTKLKNDGVLR